MKFRQKIFIPHENAEKIFRRGLKKLGFLEESLFDKCSNYLEYAAISHEILRQM